MLRICGCGICNAYANVLAYAKHIVLGQLPDGPFGCGGGEFLTLLGRVAGGR